MKTLAHFNSNHKSASEKFWIHKSIMKQTNLRSYKKQPMSLCLLGEFYYIKLVKSFYSKEMYNDTNNFFNKCPKLTLKKILKILDSVTYFVITENWHFKKLTIQRINAPQLTQRFCLDISQSKKLTQHHNQKLQILG